MSFSEFVEAVANLAVSTSTPLRTHHQLNGSIFIIAFSLSSPPFLPAQTLLHPDPFRYLPEKLSLFIDSSLLLPVALAYAAAQSTLPRTTLLLFLFCLLSAPCLGLPR